jgi:hypothetical protein
MKRPTEFWAVVALALVIAYMIHDAHGERKNTEKRAGSCDLYYSDWPCLKAEGCFGYNQI